MTFQLLLSALIKYVFGVVLVGALLFIPAGTLDFWNAWLFMGVLFIPMFFAGIVLMIRNPELLEKRLDVREKESEQKAVIALGCLMFVFGFVVAGLSFRFGWLRLPEWISWVAAIVLLIAYAIYAEVLRENVYLSRTVEVQEDQKVIDTGMYGVVRHPMYFVTLIMFLVIPLVLGSIPSFVVFLLYPLLVVRRIRNEEKVLTEGLPGYAVYKVKVKYRLIPFIW